MLLLVGVFGGVALLLATLGVYSVISYLVAQRGREISIRVALGAHASDIVRLVVRQGVALALIGAAVGAIAALASTRVLKSLLYSVSTTDPLAFARRARDAVRDRARGELSAGAPGVASRADGRAARRLNFGSDSAQSRSDHAELGARPATRTTTTGSWILQSARCRLVANEDSLVAVSWEDENAHRDAAARTARKRPSIPCSWTRRGSSRNTSRASGKRSS